MSNYFYNVSICKSEPAAARRKNAATAAGRGCVSGSRISRGAAKESFAPKGASSPCQILNHGFKPSLHSFAAPRLALGKTC
jgi:hypothetical protein